MCCSVVFVVTLRFLVINILSSRAVNTAAYYQRCVITCETVAVVHRRPCLPLRRRRPTSCNVSSTRQHESSRTRTSSTKDSLISGEISYTAAGRCRPGSVQSLRPGVQVSAQDGSWIPVYLLPTRLRHLWPSHLRSANRGHLDFLCMKLASYGGRSFTYLGPSNWNSLPAYLRDNSLSLSSFKHHLKTFLFSFRLSTRLAHAARLEFFYKKRAI